MSQRSVLTPALVFFISLAALSAQEIIHQPDNWAFLDSVVTAKLIEHEVPGAVVVVVSGNEMVHLAGYGQADIAADRPVDGEQTVFRIASVSKVFTATLALQLIHQGLLDLDADINGYFDAPIVDDNMPGAVTMRHLLTHTAGFEQRNIGRRTFIEADVGTLRDYLYENLPPRTIPSGTAMAYSNHGMALAGLVLEQVTGKPYEDIVQEVLLKPLGMTSSSFERPGQFGDRLATGYARGKDGPEPFGFAFLRTPPASMLMTTGPDMARFIIAQLNKGRVDGRQVIEAAVITEMQGRQFTHHDRMDGIGFAWFRGTRNGLPVVAHSGNLLAFSSYLHLFPEERLGFFFAFNRRSGAANQEIVSAIFDRYLPADTTVDSNYPSPTVRSRMAKDFKGRYFNINNPVTTMERLDNFPGGGIRVKPTEEGDLIFNGRTIAREIEPLFFEGESADDIVAFSEDEFGKIDLLYLGVGAYRRVPWYGSGELHALTTIIFAATFLIGLIESGFASRRILPGAEGATRAAANAGRRRLVTAGALNFVFIAGVFTGLNIFDPRFGLPLLFKSLFVLPLAAIATTLYAMPPLIQAFRARAYGLGRSLHLAWAAFAALAIIPFYIYWNLLGFQF